MKQSPQKRPGSDTRMPVSGIGDVTRIRFVPQTTTGENVRREFTQPRRMLAIEAPASLASSTPDPSLPEYFEGFYILHAPLFLSSEMQKAADLWLSAPDDPNALRPVIVRLESATIHWRPGRAIVQCADTTRGNILAALIEFAFFESELRRLECSLLPYEASALADAALAYRIGQTSRPEWDRLGQTMESLSVMRLAFVVTEPHLAIASRSLDPEGRRLVARLIARSGMPARLASFSTRLEACEDLYEGAVDRITDFRVYHTGFVLETIIVILLAVEVIAMAITIFVRH